MYKIKSMKSYIFSLKDSMLLRSELVNFLIRIYWLRLVFVAERRLFAAEAGSL